ncbi:hypothetical protein FDP41_006393 [Naegleria fowleri]|uniref:Uncharacterized protein n=1 Tax=Naegleria fowleri TaxID=5763 RepID=A0A6A5BIV2_NAEFO|nr:uncharacterized protein FDP41_006393 [Naegleria fowleri]KAF0974361.1 hypothetical protein FDP41_006393 [Naegleria fowleri]
MLAPTTASPLSDHCQGSSSSLMPQQQQSGVTNNDSHFEHTDLMMMRRRRKSDSEESSHTTNTASHDDEKLFSGMAQQQASTTPTTTTTVTVTARERQPQNKNSPSSSSPMQSVGGGVRSSPTSISPSVHSKKASSPNTPQHHHHFGKIEDEEGYVRNLLEMSRSRRRKKNQELLEAFQHFRSELSRGGDIQREEDSFDPPSFGIDQNDDRYVQHETDPYWNDLDGYEDEGLENDHSSMNLHQPQESYEPSSIKNSSGYDYYNSNTSNSSKCNNNSINNSPFSSCQPQHKEADSPENHHYFTPTVSSEVRRVATTFAHQQHQHLSDDRSSYLLKRIEELKSMNIKAMLESVSSTKDTFTGVDASGSYHSNSDVNLSNKSRSSSPSATSHSAHRFSSRLVNDITTFPANMPPSPKGSKQYEEERRKRIVARNNLNYEEKARNELNLIPEEIPECTSRQKNTTDSSSIQRTRSPSHCRPHNNNATLTPIMSSKSPLRTSSSLSSSELESKIFTPRPGSSHARISAQQTPSRFSSTKNNIQNNGASRSSFSPSSHSMNSLCTGNCHTQQQHFASAHHRNSTTDTANTYFSPSKTRQTNLKSPRTGAHSPHYRPPRSTNSNISSNNIPKRRNTTAPRADQKSPKFARNENLQFDYQERLILEEIWSLDEQLNKSSVFKNIVSNLEHNASSSNKGAEANGTADSTSSTPKTPRYASRMANGHGGDASNDKQNSSFSSLNRSGNFSYSGSFLNARPLTPSSSRASSRSGVKTPSSQYSSRIRPAGFDPSPKELTVGEITKKNREKYAHVKPKVMTHRGSVTNDTTSPESQNGNSSKIVTPKQRPASASRNLSAANKSTTCGSSNIHLNNTTELSLTPKRSASLSKSRSTTTTPQSTTTSVNVKLRNILIENDEYKRVWGEIEREELRILKFKTVPTLNESTQDKRSMIVNSSEAPDFQPSPNTTSKTTMNSTSSGMNEAVQAMMNERIRSIEEGLKRIASSYDFDNINMEDHETSPNMYTREAYTTEDLQHDKTLLEDMESKYCILQDNPQKENQVISSSDKYDINERKTAQENETHHQKEQKQQSFEEDNAAMNSSMEEEVSTTKQHSSSRVENSPYPLNENPRITSHILNESTLSVNASLFSDLSQLQSNPDFRKFINEKLDKIERECTLRQQQLQTKV